MAGRAGKAKSRLIQQSDLNCFLNSGPNVQLAKEGVVRIGINSVRQEYKNNARFRVCPGKSTGKTGVPKAQRTHTAAGGARSGRLRPVKPQTATVAFVAGITGRKRFNRLRLHVLVAVPATALQKRAASWRPRPAQSQRGPHGPPRHREAQRLGRERFPGAVSGGRFGRFRSGRCGGYLQPDEVFCRGL